VNTTYIIKTYKYTTLELKTAWSQIQEETVKLLALCRQTPFWGFCPPAGHQMLCPAGDFYPRTPWPGSPSSEYLERGNVGTAAIISMSRWERHRVSLKWHRCVMYFCPVYLSAAAHCLVEAIYAHNVAVRKNALISHLSNNFDRIPGGTGGNRSQHHRLMACQRSESISGDHVDLSVRPAVSAPSGYVRCSASQIDANMLLYPTHP